MTILKHYGTKGMHWYERNYQYLNGSLTPAGRERYLKGARAKAQETIDKSFAGAVGARQRKRYLTWSMAENEWQNNQNEKNTKARVKARKNEARDFMPALNSFFNEMRNVKDKKVQYNEDLLGKIWSEEYKKAIIEPALRSYEKALNYVRGVDESDPEYAAFIGDKAKMKRYGYSDLVSVTAEEDGIDMSRFAYVNYLIKKGKVEI